ncbi:hypothetical protein [Amycolatopsis circi]|uniref:hypothetical protein n=1 Tax=Amycolatopsis circi TaxID=871959 RepID=UPI000E27F661|nr:hypothetical protein [Amycolatopsis circi]
MSDTISRRDATAGEFAELICADPAWLRAEFEAIVATSFGEAPLPGDEPRPRSGGRAERPVPTSVWRAWPTERRERSPPMRSGSTAAVTSLGR